MWTPHFGSCVSHSIVSSIFIWKIDFLLIIWKWLGVATYFCFIFKRVNKIRKKNPKCDSLFRKRWSVKNLIGFGGQVTYREGTVETVAPLWVPKNGSLLIKWSNHGNWWINQWIPRMTMLMWKSKHSIRTTEVGAEHTLASNDQRAIKKKG